MATSTVPMFDSQGNLGDVPYDQMNAARAAGAKPAVNVLDPQGNHGYVPADRVKDAVAAGAKVLPFEQQEVQHPSVWQDIVSNLKGMVTNIPTVTSPYPGTDLERKQEVAQQSLAEDQTRKQAGYGPVYRALAPVAEAAGTNVPAMEKGAAEGDENAVLGAAAVGEGLAAAPLAAEGALSGVKAASGVALDTTRSVRAAMPEETAGLPKGALQGAEDVYRAAAPVGTNTRFRANVYASAGDLAEIGREVNTRLSASKGGIVQPDMRVRVTVDAINDHLSEMYKTERAPQIANHANAPVPLELSEDGQAGLSAMSRSGEANVRAIARKAQSGQLTLADADQLARSVNSELQKYESMDPAQQAAARVTSKSVAGLKELDRVLTEGIDDQLQIDGQPGIRSYERRYAGLAAIRNQLERRINAAELERPGPVKAAGRAVAQVASGRSGIASASQAAVADVRPGRMLERGLGRLADSGIKANRALPRTPAPLELTPPPGRVPLAGQDQLPFNEGETQDMQTGPNEPLHLTGEGRVPPAGQDQLPFNEGETQDMQTGPNGPLHLTGEGRVPPSTQQDLNFNGADMEPPARRATPRNGGPAFTDAERQKFLARQQEVDRALNPNAKNGVKNPFDNHPSHMDAVRRYEAAQDILSGRKPRGKSIR